MNRSRRTLLYLGIASLPLIFHSALNCGVAEEKTTLTPSGLKIFSAGHSLHVFMPRILSELATSAGIVGHEPIHEAAAEQISHCQIEQSELDCTDVDRQLGQRRRPGQQYSADEQPPPAGDLGDGIGAAGGYRAGYDNHDRQERKLQ